MAAEARPARPRPGFAEFVALVAALMALQALGVDAMLPALPAIGAALGLRSAAQAQLIVVTYVAGMGAGQLLWGILSDRYGRRPVILAGVALYLLCALLLVGVRSFAALLVLRFAQGAVAAASVVCRSIIRDLYSGRRMARVMSLTFIVFLGVPVLAPSLGQLILVWLHWRWIFGCFAVAAGLVLLWAALRLPETLHPEYRLTITTRHVYDSTRLVLTDPTSICHTLALTLMFGSLIAYVGSVQQIFASVFHRPQLMPAMFALCASAMGVTSFLNSRLVERLGMRLIGHSALLAFIAIALAHTLLAQRGYETMLSFVLLQAATLATLGLAASNLGAMAMEPLAAIAGIGAALQGFITSVGAALVAAVIGAQFDGTTTPLAAGALAAGLGSIVFVLIAENGRLFRPHYGVAEPGLH